MSLDGVDETARERYGENARVVAAEEVRTGGIGGFFAKRFMEVTVEIPDAPKRQPHWTAHRRLPIDDLLDQADARDTVLAPSAVPPLSTESDAFTDVLADLRRYAQPNGPVEPGALKIKRPIVLLRAPGDLVIIAGIGGDAELVATALALSGTVPGENSSFELAAAGTTAREGLARVDDRRGAFAARARGVENGHATIVAWGIAPGDEPLATDAAAIASTRPDQVWLAVDASRKHDDTERWVTALCTLLPVQAMAVLRTGFTATPETVKDLGLPEAWSDAVG
jgi:hypothetical protein